jgi:hypothetical protein
MSAPKKQTAVQWLEKQFVKLETTIGVHGIMYELIEQAKAMEKEHKKDMLMDIDTDLSLIEDFAKGELGNNITELRIKIAKLLTL